MNTIICDTNIWYKLGSAEISKEEIEGKDLGFHWFSMAELTTTNKSLTNPVYLKNALFAVLDTRALLYHYPPLNHIVSLHDPCYEYEANMQAVLAGLIISLNNPPQLPEHEVTFHGKRNVTEMKKTIATETNNNSEELRKMVKNKIQYWKFDNTNSVRQYLVNEVNRHFKTEVFNIDSFNWSKLELFEITMGYLAKALVLGKTILKENDLVDIFQLVYVQPGTLFWTKDKKIRNIIIEAGMGHYLYEL